MTTMMSPIAKFLIWMSNKNFWIRSGEYFLTFLCIITLNFFLPRMMPGDPFALTGSSGDELTVSYTEEQLAHYRSYYGLDRPLATQYREYLQQILCGDLGYSIYFQTEVNQLLFRRAFWTLGIVTASLCISCSIGTLMGVWSAWKRNHWLDRGLYMVMVGLAEIPSFIIGVLLLFGGAAWLGWFPLAGGMKPFGIYSSGWGQWLDILHHAALPIAALAMAQVGGFYLIARSSMMTVLSKDYMRTARGKGLSQRRILFWHGLRNGALPIVNRIFLSLGMVFSSAILVENVFSYPGLGQLVRESIIMRDYVLIQGVFLTVAGTVLTMNWLADRVCRKLDPRLQD